MGNKLNKGQTMTITATISDTNKEVEWAATLITFEIKTNGQTFEISEWLNSDGTLEEVDSHIETNQTDVLNAILNANKTPEDRADFDQAINKAVLMSQIFGRVDDAGNIAVLTVADGEPVNTLPFRVWPVGSDLGAGYDHPDGITLTTDDAKKIGLEIHE